MEQFDRNLKKGKKFIKQYIRLYQILVVPVRIGLLCNGMGEEL